MGDIFALFRSPHHLEKLNKYLNTKHANLKFTSEKEVNGSLLFLDVLISRNKKCFTTTVYHKPTFGGVYSNFNSFIDDEYKHGEVNYLKDVLKKNSFPTTLVNKCKKSF